MKAAKQLIREVLTVIIGILIALFINDWNDKRKERDYLKQVYSSMENELQESITDIDRVVPKQIASADTIQAYLNDPNVTIYQLMMKSDGIYSANIKTTSWNAISNSRIELIDYEKLSALSEIAARKENLNGRLEKQLDFLFQNFEETSRSKKEILRMMILDIVGSEKRLQQFIQETIDNGLAEN